MTQHEQNVDTQEIVVQDPFNSLNTKQFIVQKYIEDPLAEFILGENPAEGTILEEVMNKEEDGLEIKFSKEVKTDA